MRRRRTFDLLEHRIVLEPVRPGVWRYRVWRHAPTSAAVAVVRTAELVCDRTVVGYWPARMRARDVARRRDGRKARWPQ